MEVFRAAGVILLCFGLDSALAKTEEKYVVAGKGVELRPPSRTPATLTSVEWRHGENIAAEWNTGGQVDIYRNFKGRTELNTATGILIINNVTQTETGMYSVFVNNNRLEDNYKVIMIEEVPNPSIWVKGVTADNTMEMECEGDVENAKPVKYYWNITENGEWVQLEQKVVIVNNETTRCMERFSCKIQNPAGEKMSKSKVNPFYPKPENNGGNPALWALLLLLLVVVLIGVIAYKRKAILAYFNSNTKENPGSVSPNPVNEPLNQ